MKRIFVVGCPRSGTTLLQSLLASNSSVISFPESHFFTALFERRKLLRKKLRIASIHSRPNLKEFVSEIGCEEMKVYLPWYALSLHQHTEAFVRVLDKTASEQGKTAWIEKTPDHIRFVDFIESSIDNPLFIHIVRNGADVVASLADVTQRYPEVWDGPWDIDRCLRKWIRCAEATSRHISKPNHHLVKYESLVDSPSSTIERVSNFVDIEFDLASVLDREADAENIVLQSEPWKAESTKSIYNTQGSKFYKLFDKTEQAYILEEIARANLGSFDAVHI